MATARPAVMPETKRATTLAEQYCAVRAHTETLAAPLSSEDQTIQSMPDVSPTKWHRAHTTWFFETFLLAPHCPGYRAFDPQFGYLFNSYYETVGARHPRPRRGLLSRPGTEEIAAYRRHVDSAMVVWLDARDLDSALGELVVLGLHHEQQHQELLLMDIKHVLSCNPLRPAYDRAHTEPAPAIRQGWIEHDGGLLEIGHAGDGFAFDNEQPRHAVYVHPFSIASQPVTNGEWLAFVADDGYRRPDLWLSDGWATVQADAWDAPLYWEAGEMFTLAGMQPIDEHAPVCHVSYYEADAYARWADARLPTEAEWEVAALDGVGAVWEWTGSAYLPYPGFRPAAGAVGEYNGKFMVNQHVLRGSSCATPPGHARATYRNFFPPAARWAFSGVRIAR